MAAPVGKQAADLAGAASPEVASAHYGPREVRARSPIDRLFSEAFEFDFFQAVRLLEQAFPDRQRVGRTAPPSREIVHFRSHVSLGFPPSSIYELAELPGETPVMAVTFFGLLGTVGALPRHYTELILKHEKENRGGESRALRAWFDLFNHRLIALFYRAWAKYRFWIAYERGDARSAESDVFTLALRSLIGLGTRGLRDRLRVSSQPLDDAAPARSVLTEVDDHALLFLSGMLSQRQRNAESLEAMLEEYFGLPVKVEQFQGQWLQLEDWNRSYLGEAGLNNALGTNVIAGERVWDVQSRLRVTLGPLPYHSFHEMLPDASATPEGKAFFKAAHLIRLYVGLEFNVDIQLIPRLEDVPDLQLPEGTGDGPRLGWNAWLTSQTLEHDPGDAVFDAYEPEVLLARNSGAI